MGDGVGDFDVPMRRAFVGTSAWPEVPAGKTSKVSFSKDMVVAVLSAGKELGKLTFYQQALSSEHQPQTCVLLGSRGSTLASHPTTPDLIPSIPKNKIR